MKKLGIAMIGCGFMGKTHSNAWKKLNFFFDPGAKAEMLVACARSESAGQNAVTKWGWQTSATDYKEVLKRDDVDIVDIGTPNNTHAEMWRFSMEWIEADEGLVYGCRVVIAQLRKIKLAQVAVDLVGVAALATLREVVVYDVRPP